MKLWKKISIGIGIVLIIFIIMTLRKFMIFTDLNNKNKAQQKNGNFYSKITTEQKIVETYTKGDSKKVILKSDNQIHIQVTKPEYWIVYDGVNKTGKRFEKNTEKVTMIESQDKISNFADYTTVFEKIWNSICSHIKTEKIDGQEYYVISGHNTNFFAPSENSKGQKVYIDKNTGLTFKIIETVNEDGNVKDKVTTYEYQFNTVTDEDVAELDSSEYELQ